MPRTRPPLSDRIDFAALMEPVALRLLGDPNTKLSKPPRDVRYGTHGSMSVDCEAGRFFDHEEARGGGVIDLIRQKLACDHLQAVAWLRSEGFLDARAAKESRQKIAAIYDYTDETADLLFQVVRYEPKRFRQRRPD